MTRHPKYRTIPSEASSGAPLCAVVVTNSRGSIRLATSGASRWIKSHFTDWALEKGRVPVPLQQLTRRCAMRGRTTRRYFTAQDGEFTVTVVGRQDLAALVFERIAGPALQRLTPRQTEILTWVAEGKQNKEISKILAISPRTVQHHLERVYERLGVANRTAAARMLLAAKMAPKVLG